MLTILLIRSGRTEYDCLGRIQGTLDVPLSEDGRREVLSAASELIDQQASISALYAGPCRSAQETAEILAQQLKLKPKTIDSLHNLNQGLWQGMLFDEVKSKQPKVYRQWQERPDTVCPPEGETLQEARERLRKALSKLARKHKSGNIALVLGQPLASVLRSMLREGQSPSVCVAEGNSAPLWEPLPVSAEGPLLAP
jgi:probable phosphoglycerate mutase